VEDNKPPCEGSREQSADPTRDRAAYAVWDENRRKFAERLKRMNEESELAYRRLKSGWPK
jgi:hypothetical protein